MGDVHLEDVLREGLDSAVPVVGGVAVEGAVDHGEDDAGLGREGGWVGELFLCARKVEENEAVGMSYCELGVG